MDLPVMGNVFMPTSQVWEYGPWAPVTDDHMGVGMAFTLLIPARGSCGLVLLRAGGASAAGAEFCGGHGKPIRKNRTRG